MNKLSIYGWIFAFKTVELKNKNEKNPTKWYAERFNFFIFFFLLFGWLQQITLYLWFKWFSHKSCCVVVVCWKKKLKLATELIALWVVFHIFMYLINVTLPISIPISISIHQSQKFQHSNWLVRIHFIHSDRKKKWFFSSFAILQKEKKKWNFIYFRICDGLTFDA